MGNAQATLSGGTDHIDGQTDVLHFEHTITGRLVLDINSSVPISPRHLNLSDPGLGEGKVVKITLAGDKIVLEDGDVVLGRAKPAPILETSFASVKELVWDHSHSSVKIVVAGAVKPLSPNASSRAPNLSLPGGPISNQYILIVNNSLQLEQEVKVRLNVLRKLATEKKNISFQYIGMFAGPTKPKPFQRKRANLSKLKQGQLPSLSSMKQYATSQYHGAAQPVQTAQSRRLDLALQHIHEGFVTFPVLHASHSPTQEASTLIIDYDGVKYCNDLAQGPSLTLPFSSIDKWDATDQFVPGSSDNGLRILTQQGATYFFQIKYSWDVKHVMEYFWNNVLMQDEDADPLPSSTHGRIVEELFTLTGSIIRPAIPVGNLKITDSSGRLVCDLDPSGTVTAARRGSTGVVPPATDGGHVRRNSLTSANNGRRGSFTSKPVAIERTHVKAFWKKVVMHQGWLLKRGGATKKWIKRYFVLYNTCMGHILCYYGDYTETALYSDVSRERNVIDCSKVEFIRPVSNNPETPDFAFDIQSIMRDWTVCAADQNDLQTWLKSISYAVDADVGILPDDEAAFLVKPRQDPTMKLYVDEYSTFLRIHSWGVTVEALEGESRHRVFFWPYTDLYKWSILSQKGKIALQLTVFSNAEYTQKIDFIFRTRDAPRIASVIEYYIEKFMCVMHLRLELGGADSSSGGGNSPNQGRRASAQVPLPPKSPLFRKATDNWDDERDEQEEGEANWASDGEDDDVKQEDFLNFDVEEPLEAQRRASFGSPTPTAVGVSSPVSILTNVPPSNSTPNVSPKSGSVTPPPPPIQYLVKGISVSALARMEGWNNALITSPQGVLFENDQVQLLLRHEYQLHQGSIALMLKNVGNLPIEAFISNATSTTPGILVQATPVEPRLGPGETTTQQIRVICMEPFQISPSLTLEFTTPDSATIHSKHTYSIPLPVSPLHFLSPVEFDRATFMQQWQNITVPEVIDTFPATRPVQPEAVTALFNNPSIKMGAVRELTMRNDSLQLLTFACSLETGTLSPTGMKLRVGALVRLEASLQASAFRLTVRAVHPTAATAIFRALKQQILTL